MEYTVSSVQCSATMPRIADWRSNQERRRESAWFGSRHMSTTVEYQWELEIEMTLSSRSDHPTVSWRIMSADRTSPLSVQQTQRDNGESRRASPLCWHALRFPRFSSPDDGDYKRTPAMYVWKLKKASSSAVCSTKQLSCLTGRESNDPCWMCQTCRFDIVQSGFRFRTRWPLWVVRRTSIILPESTHFRSIGKKIRVQIDVVQRDAPLPGSFRVMHQHLVISYGCSNDIIEGNRIQRKLAQAIGVLGILGEYVQIQVAILIVPIGMTASHVFEKKKRKKTWEGDSRCRWKWHEKMNIRICSSFDTMATKTGKPIALLIARESLLPRKVQKIYFYNCIILLLDLTKFKSMYKALEFISAWVNYKMRPERENYMEWDSERRTAKKSSRLLFRCHNRKRFDSSQLSVDIVQCCRTRLQNIRWSHQCSIGHFQLITIVSLDRKSEIRSIDRSSQTLLELR